MGIQETHLSGADPIEVLPVRSSVREALRQARQELDRLYGDRLVRLVLFGSQARGEATEGSDVDLLVALLGEVDKHAELRRVSRIASHVVYSHQELIGFVVFSERRAADPYHPLLMNVEQEGIAL